MKSSKLWRRFNELKLIKNMRVHQEEVEFVEWLLRVGSGFNVDKKHSDFVELHKEVLTEDIVETVFGSDINSLPLSDLSSRAILCPRNDDTFKMNETILNQLSGEAVTYYNVDIVTNCQSEEEQHLYPLEFLNSLTPMGMPPHQPNLKIGCCVMLLRNMNSKHGLCNGTRLIVEKLGTNIIDCSIFTGDQKGNRVFIPRMCLDINDIDIPFQLRRKQFPAFGVYLPQPVFTHGQLYTALSRVRSKNGLAIQIRNGKSQGKIYEGDEAIYTYNCVHSELL